MTSMVTIVQGLEAPELEPRTARLLDTVVPTEGIAWSDPAGAGGAVYESMACLDLGGSYDVCDAPEPTEYQEAVGVNSFRFVSDLGIKCRMGIDEAQFNRVVELRESDNVELNLMAIRFTGGRGGAAAEDLTPAGGAYAMECGLAVLEGHAAANYAGRPIIHAPVTVASLLAGDPGFKGSGKVMHTGLGNPFVAGAGYEAKIGPDGSTAPAGEFWMYATGAMRIRRSKRIQTEPILDRATNIVYIRSQRIYVIDVDCYLSAVRVKF